MTKPKLRMPLDEETYKATLFVESTKRRKFQEALEHIAQLPCTKVHEHIGDEEEVHVPARCGPCFAKEILKSEGFRKSFLK